MVSPLCVTSPSTQWDQWVLNSHRLCFQLWTLQSVTALDGLTSTVSLSACPLQHQTLSCPFSSPVIYILSAAFPPLPLFLACVTFCSVPRQNKFPLPPSLPAQREMSPPFLCHLFCPSSFLLVLSSSLSFLPSFSFWQYFLRRIFPPFFSSPYPPPLAFWVSFFPLNSWGSPACHYPLSWVALCGSTRLIWFCQVPSAAGCTKVGWYSASKPSHFNKRNIFGHFNANWSLSAQACAGQKDLWFMDPIRERE